MLNFLWLFMILAGIVYAAFTGNLQAVTDAALDSRTAGSGQFVSRWQVFWHFGWD